jgi:hypothetical protein
MSSPPAPDGRARKTSDGDDFGRAEARAGLVDERDRLVAKPAAKAAAAVADHDAVVDTLRTLLLLLSEIESPATGADRFAGFFIS